MPQNPHSTVKITCHYPPITLSSMRKEDSTQILKIINSLTERIFRVRLQSGASKNEIVQVCEDALKVWVSAPISEGKANRKE